jgi:hypothetical protein
VFLPCPPTADVLYAAAGTDPFELLDRGVAAAARLSGAQMQRKGREVEGQRGRGAEGQSGRAAERESGREFRIQ